MPHAIIIDRKTKGLRGDKRIEVLVECIEELVDEALQAYQLFSMGVRAKMIEDGDAKKLN